MGREYLGGTVNDGDIATKKYVDEAIAANPGGMSDIVEDTTPQLGGPLDLNGKTIGGSEVDDDSNTTIDWGAGHRHKKALSADVTFTFTAPPKPGYFYLRLIQDSTARTPTWPSSVKWLCDYVPDIATVSKVYLFVFEYDGTYYRGSMLGWYAA